MLCGNVWYELQSFSTSCRLGTFLEMYLTGSQSICVSLLLVLMAIASVHGLNSKPSFQRPNAKHPSIFFFTVFPDAAAQAYKAWTDDDILAALCLALSNFGMEPVAQAINAWEDFTITGTEMLAASLALFEIGLNVQANNAWVDLSAGYLPALSGLDSVASAKKAWADLTTGTEKRNKHAVATWKYPRSTSHHHHYQMLAAHWPYDR